jgi:hypothetical protein
MAYNKTMPRFAITIAAVLAAFAAPAAAIEHVTFRKPHDGGREEQSHVAGRILAEDADGSVLLQRDDGALWPIMADEIVERRSDDAPFEPLTALDMVKRLEAELPGFKFHTTPHYVVAYDTSRHYAVWASSLLERLHQAFTNYWSRQGCDIVEPEFPLVVVIHASQNDYQAASTGDLGSSSGSVIGYYNQLTNRVRMYDLTGSEQLRGGDRRGSRKEINQMLSQPAAVPLVSTIVHEATHQIAFNCGLQQRLSDLPLWLCEGMAVYFEAPDLTSIRGWQGIGRVNYPRLEVFHQNLRRWRKGDLAKLVADDTILRDPRTAGAAYSDAWALNYYLLRYHPEEFTKYVQHLAGKPPMIDTRPRQRREEFRQHFGDIGELESDFLQRMSRLK